MFRTWVEEKRTFRQFAGVMSTIYSNMARKRKVFAGSQPDKLLAPRVPRAALFGACATPNVCAYVRRHANFRFGKVRFI